MTDDPHDFDAFARRLDDEWRRERLRQAVPPPVGASAEVELLEALERADPLGATGGWMRSAWPWRLAFAGVACACLVLGLVIGRATTDRPLARGGIPPVPVQTPDYTPGTRTALGIGAPVRPESERKFLEAMAFYGSPDFAAKAAPALREAVALDRANDQAQFWLGVTLLLRDRAAEAVPPLEEAVRLAPASVPYKQYLVYAYLRTGDTARALRVQTELLKRR
jgi:tetratricopeptide (TPR) repeat protein